MVGGIHVNYHFCLRNCFVNIITFTCMITFEEIFEREDMYSDFYLFSINDGIFHFYHQQTINQHNKHRAGGIYIDNSFFYDNVS